MSKVVRIRTYDLTHPLEQGGDAKPIEVVRIKKWSTGKLFAIVRDLSSFLRDAFDPAGFAGEEDDSAKTMVIITQLVTTLAASTGKATKLIEESVETKNLDPEELDPEDFLGLTYAILEQNLTEGLAKNFRKLLNLVNEKFGSDGQKIGSIS